MTLAPLIAAPLAVQIHAGAAIAALVLGTLQLLRPRRDGAHHGTHRWIGRIWVALMAVTAISTAAIGSVFVTSHPALTLGGYGPIHILSIVTLFGLAGAIAAIRAGHVAAHRKAMRQLYLFALVGAGLFTLAPGRIMGAVVFGW